MRHLRGVTKNEAKKPKCNNQIASYLANWPAILIALRTFTNKKADAVCIGYFIITVNHYITSINGYSPNIHAKINGATIVASLSTINLGVLTSSLPQVIFSFGTAPE